MSLEITCRHIWIVGIIGYRLVCHSNCNNTGGNNCLVYLKSCRSSILHNKTERGKIAHSQFRLFAKLFYTFSKEIIYQCMWYMNCLPLEYIIDLRSWSSLTRQLVLIMLSYMFCINLLAKRDAHGAGKTRYHARFSKILASVYVDCFAEDVKL